MAFGGLITLIFHEVVQHLQDHLLELLIRRRADGLPKLFRLAHHAEEALVFLRGLFEELDFARSEQLELSFLVDVG